MPDTVQADENREIVGEQQHQGKAQVCLGHFDSSKVMSLIVISVVLISGLTSDIYSYS